MLEVPIPMKVTLSLENSYYIFCDQREEICREWALFLKCPQTWGQAGWCFICERQPWGHCSQRMVWFRILRGRKGNQWGKERKNWNVNFVKLKGKVKTYNGNLKKKKSSDMAISKGKQHIPFSLYICKQVSYVFLKFRRCPENNSSQAQTGATVYSLHSLVERTINQESEKSGSTSGLETLGK